MKIDYFKQEFYSKLGKYLSLEEYIFRKSKEIFERIDDDHVFILEAFSLKMGSYVVIKINCYYYSKRINRFIKPYLDKYQSRCNKELVGGSASFICEHYYHSSFITDTGDFWFGDNDSMDKLVEEWYKIYAKYLKPFLEQCKSIDFLYSLINNPNIKSSGFVAGQYNERAIKGLFIAYLAGKDIDLIEALACKYEIELGKFKHLNIKQYMNIKNQFIEDIRKNQLTNNV